MSHCNRERDIENMGDSMQGKEERSERIGASQGSCHFTSRREIEERERERERE